MIREERDVHRIAFLELTEICLYTEIIADDAAFFTFEESHNCASVLTCILQFFRSFCKT